MVVRENYRVTPTFGDGLCLMQSGILPGPQRQPPGRRHGPFRDDPAPWDPAASQSHSTERAYRRREKRGLAGGRDTRVASAWGLETVESARLV